MPALPSLPCAQAHLQAPPVATAAAVAASAVSSTPQSLKLTYPETLDRIKEEFQFLQNQYHRYGTSKPLCASEERCH